MALPADETGTGPAVVLLHAGVADRTMWAELLPPIAAAGYRAVAVDLPGFGDAPADPQHAPYTAALDAMDALEIRSATLVGCSYGGAVALRMAALAPERVTAMALVSAPAPNLGPSPELEAAWEAEESALERGDTEAAVAAVVDTWTLPDAPPGLRDRVAAMQRRAFASQGDAGAEANDDDDPLEPDSSALATLNIPTLLAVGEHDMSDFREGAELLAREMPEARLVVIPGAGHLAPLEQPDAFLHLVLDFLRQLPT